MAFLAGDYALSAQRNDEASAGLRPSADPLREGERAALLGQRASLAKELGRLAEAERLRRQSLEIFARAYGPTNPRIVGQWLNLGAIELDLHHPDRAIGEFERALPIYQAAWGATHPWTIRAAFNLAEADIELRRYVDAEALLSPQLDNLRKQRPSAPDLLAWGLDLQGKTAFRQARYEQARNLADESIRILRQEQGGKSMTLASPLRNLARAELALGEPAAALAHDLEALDVSLSAFGERHGDVLDALLDLGTTRLHLSDLAGAKIDLDRAMKLGIDLGPDRAAGCATVQVVQAEMALLQNDHIAAARLLDLAEPVLASNRLGEVEWVERARALRARLKS
jgi:tetratricopeptide (TPR) repeat protein